MGILPIEKIFRSTEASSASLRLSWGVAGVPPSMALSHAVNILKWRYTPFDRTNHFS
jgi:hypothetical protein